MTIRLRPHHLLCMLSFVGKGYTPAFTANMASIISRLGAGETILTVEGPDDICAPIAGAPSSHCHLQSARRRDIAAATAVGGLLGMAIHPGTRLCLTAETIIRLQQAFASGSIRKACAACEWGQLCTSVANSGFANSLLSEDAAPQNQAAHLESKRASGFPPALLCPEG